MIGHVGGSGLLNPIAGNGTEVMMSMIAAPCEYPPSTSLVSGQVLTTS